MKKKQTKIGVIIVSHNSSDAVRITLASLQRAENITPYEIILVDNASNDLERKKIQTALKKHVSQDHLAWKYLQKEKNLGFSGGNNAGIELFLKDENITHVCLLNSDVIVTDFWLDRLVNYGCDVITPVTNKADSSQRIPIDFQININDCLDKKKESINENEFSKVNSFSQNWHKVWEGNCISIDEDTTFFCVLLSRRILQQIGLLDTTFFPGGYEDNDYCERIRKNGESISIARDVFIYHFGSASFELLPRDYFNQNALRNRHYLEEKHSIIWEQPFNAPYESFAQDILYLPNVNASASRVSYYLNLHFSDIDNNFKHVQNEFKNLQLLIHNSTQTMPTELDVKIKVSTDLVYDVIRLWDAVSLQIKNLYTIKPLDAIECNRIAEIIRSIGCTIKKLTTCNMEMWSFISASVPKRTLPDFFPRLENRIKTTINFCVKGIRYYWKLEGIVFFGGFPYPEREKDGYFQRIREIDSIFSDHSRIYIDNYSLQGRCFWCDIPAPNTYVIRIGGSWKRRYWTQFVMMLCILRCRKIYFHSILSIGRYGFLLKLPRILKFLDIHGVVPEEFHYHKDLENEKIYNQIEAYAIKRANYLIVVSNKMRLHITEKYSNQAKGVFIELPILPEIKREIISKPLINGKLVVVYAGGLQKWQQVPSMIDAISQTIDTYQHRFYCPNPIEFLDMLPLTLKNHPNLVIRCKPHEEIIQSYRECHFGFILREDIVVNHVACPTKLVEYIATGVIPIVEFDNIGDFKTLGMKFIYLQDFVNHHLPDETTRTLMIENNLHIYKKLQNTYTNGVLALQKVTIEGK